MLQKYRWMKTKSKKKFRLWTFQSIAVIEELQTKGIFKASWDIYSPGNTFISSYQWMANQLAIRKIGFNKRPPIWAWHSCNGYGNAPTLVDARCLLSDIQLEEGIKTLEFECPSDLVLLSSYGVWNQLIYDVFPLNDETKINSIKKRLFNVNEKKLKRYDCIQAALPYLKLDWVKDIRALNLKPNDFSFNEKERV